MGTKGAIRWAPLRPRIYDLTRWPRFATTESHPLPRITMRLAAHTCVCPAASLRIVTSREQCVHAPEGEVRGNRQHPASQGPPTRTGEGRGGRAVRRPGDTRMAYLGTAFAGLGFGLCLSPTRYYGCLLHPPADPVMLRSGCRLGRARCEARCTTLPFVLLPSCSHGHGARQVRAWVRARAARGLGVGRARYKAICSTTGVASCRWVPFCPSALPPRLLPLLVFASTSLLRCSLRPARAPWVPACILVAPYSRGSAPGVLEGEGEGRGGGAPSGTSHPTHWHT